MEKNVFAELTNRMRQSDEIHIESIPNIELYMEQLVIFLNQKLDAGSDQPGTKSVTKTMINNYTKAGLLIPPKNKKYSKQHILLLTLIVNLKDFLSIS